MFLSNFFIQFAKKKKQSQEVFMNLLRDSSTFSKKVLKLLRCISYLCYKCQDGMFQINPLISTACDRDRETENSVLP